MRMHVLAHAQKTVALAPGVLEQLETPEGLLKVAVVEAVNVPRSDLLTPPDPYVVYAPFSNRALQYPEGARLV